MQEQQEINAAQAEMQELKDKWLRSVAEMENLKKRTQKEKEDMQKYAVSRFAQDLLPLSDNLTRALQSCAGIDETSPLLRSLVDGISMIEKQLLNILQANGVQKIDSLGVKFDPNLHQAIGEVESSEAPGTVVEIFQEGYIISDRLLRPALVNIAKKSKD